jgi:hypothetical protein
MARNVSSASSNAAHTQDELKQRELLGETVGSKEGPSRTANEEMPTRADNPFDTPFSARPAGQPFVPDEVG